MDYTLDPVRELLKEATKLKKRKKFDEACDKLKEAYAMPGASNLTIKDRLRLPMYLQLANKSDEAWGLLDEMNRNARHEPINLKMIANQSRVFVEKEKNYTKALFFAIMGICYEIEGERFLDNKMRKSQDELERFNSKLGESKLFERPEEERKASGDYYVSYNESLVELKSYESVNYEVSRLLTKAKMSDIIERVSADIVKYLNSIEVMTRFQ